MPLMSDPMQSVINPAAAFFRPPAAPPPAAPAAPKIFSPEERIGTAEKLIEQSRKQESEAALALGKRQQEEAVFKTEQEAKLAKGEAELERKAKEGIEGSEAYQLQQDVEKEIAQARFAPTQRTAQENMMMMALINLVGFGIGAGGKGNSMAALGAMTGMLDGVQKGDMARYKQEREKFDSNLKALHERAVRVDSLLKRVADLQTRDKNAAMLELRAGLAQEGADWLRQYGDKFGLVKQQELSAQIRRDAEKMRDTAQKAKDAEDKARENRLAQVEREREAAQRRAELAITLKGMTPTKPIVVQGADGKMYQVDPSTLPTAPEGMAITPFGKPVKEEKAPSDVEKSVRQNANYIDNMAGIIERGDKLIVSNKVRGIGIIAGRVPYALAQAYLTQEEKDFIQDFMALSNQKLKDQSGATVTGAEFARQRQVLPLTSDDPATVMGKLRNWRRLVAEETAILGKGYPSTVNKYGIVLPAPQKDGKIDTTKLVRGLVYETNKGTLLWDGQNWVERE